MIDTQSNSQTLFSGNIPIRTQALQNAANRGGTTLDPVKTTAPLILASGSPRRRELLESLGMKFEVRRSDVPEERQPNEPVRSYVERLAGEKAAVIAATMPESWVIAADTVVYLDDVVLEKPADADDAVRMLEKLAGRTHTVFSGVALVREASRTSIIESVRTEVTIMPLDGPTIEWYVATGEPMDKAGAYAIQGKGAMFVDRVEGSYTNVVGLPIPTLFRMMTSVGISPVSPGTSRRVE